MCLKNVIPVLLLSVVLVVLSTGAKATTLPVILLYDQGTHTLKLTYDNGPGDLSPEVGVVLFASGIGNFTVNVDVGLSQAVLGDNTADLSFVTVYHPKSGWVGSDTLVVMFSTFDYTAQGLVEGATGGTKGGPSVTWSLGLDPTNHGCTSVPCSPTMLWSDILVSSPFADNASASINLEHPYALVQQFYITANKAGQVSSGDFYIHVPEPASFSLLAFGLIGLNGLRKKLGA